MNWLKSNLDSRLIVVIIGTLLLLGAIIPSGMALTNGGEPHEFLMNLGTEMAGALITFILITGVLEWFQQQETNKETEDELKTRLVREAGNSNNAIALNALREAKDKNLLSGKNGILKEKFFSNVDWKDADLIFANLEGSVFEDSDLRKIELEHANLANTTFEKVTLRNSNLQSADMSGITLRNVTLHRVTLRYASFDPHDVVDLRLPDGTNWTPETDMRRFTDPNHPDFWEPEWVKT